MLQLCLHLLGHRDPHQSRTASFAFVAAGPYLPGMAPDYCCCSDSIAKMAVAVATLPLMMEVIMNYCLRSLSPSSLLRLQRHRSL